MVSTKTLLLKHYYRRQGNHEDGKPQQTLKWGNKWALAYPYSIYLSICLCIFHCSILYACPGCLVVIRSKLWSLLIIIYSLASDQHDQLLLEINTSVLKLPRPHWSKRKACWMGAWTPRSPSTEAKVRKTRQIHVQSPKWIQKVTLIWDICKQSIHH